MLLFTASNGESAKEVTFLEKVKSLFVHLVQTTSPARYKSVVARQLTHQPITLIEFFETFFPRLFLLCSLCCFLRACKWQLLRFFDDIVKFTINRWSILGYIETLIQLSLALNVSQELVAIKVSLLIKNPS